MKPPSTGHEFVAPKVAMPTKEQAQKWIDAALAEVLKPSPDCAKATATTTRIGFDIANPDAAFFKTNEPALVTLARCAEKEHAYAFLLKLGNSLVQANPKSGHPELLARGMLGLGAYSDAIKLLKSELKDRPKDPNLNVTVAKTQCRLDLWADCLKQADETLVLVTPPKTADDREVGWRAQKYRARALLHVGKFDDAIKAADEAVKLGAPAAFSDAIKKEVVPSKAAATVVEKEVGDRIPLGGYHLFGKVASIGSVLDVKLYNVDAADHQFKVEAEIAGVSERAVQTVTILKGHFDTVHLNPPLKVSFDVNSIRADTPGQIALKVTRVDGKEMTIVDETIPVTLEPRDTLPLWRYLDRDHTVQRLSYEFIGAWITPNAKAIDEFLTAAKKRVPNGAAFGGGQAPTGPQVRAIYDELQSRGMSYVMDPSLFAGGEQFLQRTRLPTDVLSSTNAQCLEGTVLFATLFEAIGLRPVLTIIPSHAFVGWAPGGHDPQPAEKMFFLETTATHDAPFDRNLPYATGEFLRENAAGHFATTAPGGPQAHLIWVDRLRAAGVTPQPWN